MMMALLAMVLASRSLGAAELPAYGVCLSDSMTDGPNGTGTRVPQLETNACEPCSSLSGLPACASMCRDLNFSVAGVEAGHQCACGNALRFPQAVLNDSECNTPCISNPQAMCGGSFKIFAANVSDVPPAPPPPPPPPPDFLESRNILAGTLVLNDSYLDQCYCVVNVRVTPVTWTCVITADGFHEGGSGEHIEALVSTDRGKRWTRHRTVEPENMVPGSLPNAYAVTALAPHAGPNRTGRVYAIYNMNLDNVTCTHPSATKACTTGRNDELGHFVMKYSDNGGRHWSKKRFEVPYRLTAIDRDNTWGGQVKIMWNVSAGSITLAHLDCCGAPASQRRAERMLLQNTRRWTRLKSWRMEKLRLLALQKSVQSSCSIGSVLSKA
jgi:hypothetical protein